MRMCMYIDARGGMGILQIQYVPMLQRLLGQDLLRLLFARFVYRV